MHEVMGDVFKSTRDSGLGHMSKAISEHRFRLIDRLVEEIKTNSFAICEIRSLSEQLAESVRDTQIHGTGIRKAEIIDACRELLVQPAFEFFSNPFFSEKCIEKDHLLEAFGDTEKMQLIANTVAYSVDSVDADIIRYSLDPSGNEGSLRVVSCQTMDILLAVARFAQLWPQSTVSQDSSRRRIHSKGSILCDFCHRPTARYAHWHGMKTPDAGFVVGSKQITNDPPDKRLSQKYCGLHSKSGKDRQRNAGNYSGSLTKNRTSPGARTDIADYLRSRGVGTPHSMRLRALVTWMQARKTVAARERKKHRERIISERPSAQRLLDGILATLPRPPRITIDDNLLEMEIRPGGELIVVDVLGQKTRFMRGKQLELWDAQLRRLFADLRKRFPLGVATAFEFVWSEALGLEISIIDGETLRLTFESPTWIEAATQSKK